MGNESFYFQNGNVAKDLWDLGMVLQNISQEEFRFHVNSQKNDFANWVQFSLNNPDFAFELRKTTDLEKTRKLLSDKFSSKTSTESSTKKSDSNPLSGFDEISKEDEVVNVTSKYEVESTINSNVVETKATSDVADTKEKYTKDAVETKPVEKLKDIHSNDVQTNANDSRVSFHKSLVHTKHSLKPLILGVGFGIIVGMILMLILVRVGVF